MTKVEKMIEFIVLHHKGQTRKGSKKEPWKRIPYINHCFEVMKAVSEFGIDDEDMWCIALGHDLKEDCQKVTYELLVKEFGQEIADCIIECTRLEGDDATKAEKYEFLDSFYSKSLESVIVKIADRCCNVRDYLNTLGKESYAAKYALQAYPLIRTYLERCDELEEHIIKRVNKAVSWLAGVVESEYGFNFTEPDIEELVKGIVI